MDSTIPDQSDGVTADGFQVDGLQVDDVPWQRRPDDDEPCVNLLLFDDPNAVLAYAIGLQDDQRLTMQMLREALTLLHDANQREVKYEYRIDAMLADRRDLLAEIERLRRRLRAVGEDV